MENNKKIQVRGDKNNPYHLSVGIVLKDGNKVYMIKKDSGKYTLPSETVWLEESLKDALERGAKEELGMSVNIKRFLGSIKSYFDRGDGAEIEKTTIYFLTDGVPNGPRIPEKNEESDQVELIEIDKAVELLEAGDRRESGILSRV